MKIKKLWFVAGGIYLLEFILECTLSPLIESVFLLIIDFIVGFVTALILALPISLVLGLIPFKSMNFSQKFKIILPAFTSFILFMLLCFTGYRVYSKKVKGKDIKVPTIVTEF